VAIAFVIVAISGLGNSVADVLDETNIRVRTVMAAQDEVTPSLIERPEILGTAVGIDDDGNAVLKIYVDRDAPNVDQSIRSLPRDVHGTPAQVELMDEIRARWLLQMSAMAARITRLSPAKLWSRIPHTVF
jgi:hypothetical protein